MNKFTLCIALLAVAGVVPACASLKSSFNPKSDASFQTSADGEAPWFCHDLDCPKYEVKHTSDKWEEREYEQARLSF